MRVRGRLKNVAKKKVNEKVKIDRKGKQRFQNKVAKRSEEQKKKNIEDRGINADVMAVKTKKGEERRGKKRDSFQGEIMMENGNKQREN